MGQVHYQKPKRRSLRCCFCCIECLSGFFVLMLVATIITLLRYFLEFSDLSFTNGGNGTDLAPTQEEPTGTVLEIFAQDKGTNESPSQQALEDLRPTSPRSKMDPPQPSSRPADERRPPWSPYPTSTLSQTSPPSATQRKPSLFAASFPPRPTRVATSMVSQWRPTADAKQISSGWPTLAIKSSSSSIQWMLPNRSTPSVQWSLFSHATVNITGPKSSSPDNNPVTGSLRPNVTSEQPPFSAHRVTSPVDGNETNQYFQGSFHLLDEVYHPSYGNHTSESFRSEALKLENMIDNIFAKSALKHQYRKSFVQGLEPEPFRAKFLLKFSNNVHEPKLHPDAVVREMIQGYRETLDKVAMDVNSVQVEDYKELCLMKGTSLLSSILDANHKSNSHWDGKHLKEAEDWPWVASVMKEDVSICDGSLITDNWVLTARSCVASGTPSLYTVKLAPYAKHTSSEWLRSVAKIVHSSGTPKDLALIQLAKPAPATSSVQSICLPDPSYVTPSSTECWALGSKEKHVNKPEVLRWTVTSQTKCQLSSSSHSICAETTDLKKQLQLSTGGPFLCLGENQQVYLEGIVPVLAKSQDKSKEKMEQSVAFPRMAPWVSWIESQLFPDKAA